MSINTANIDVDGLSMAHMRTFALAIALLLAASSAAALEAGVPALVEARELIANFQAMIRNKTVAALTPWIERARAGLVASFARGVANGEAAVRAAIALPWSNGQTEGQIARLKLVKRQMYGRGKLDLLQARLIGAE